MDWVTDQIAIGNYLEAQDAALLKAQGIRSALSLDGVLRGTDPKSLGLDDIEVVPLDDGPGNDERTFLRAVSALGRLAREAPPVLVQCHAGRSRSVVVVAGHLVRSLKIEPDEALARVAAKRETAITAGLLPLLDLLG